jgi:hypothetical protein
MNWASVLAAPDAKSHSSPPYVMQKRSNKRDAARRARSSAEPLGTNTIRLTLVKENHERTRSFAKMRTHHPNNHMQEGQFLLRPTRRYSDGNGKAPARGSFEDLPTQRRHRPSVKFADQNTVLASPSATFPSSGFPRRRQTRSPGNEAPAVQQWQTDEANLGSLIDPDDESCNLVLVMGTTGSGKSYFINKLVGRDKVVEGHTLRSRTLVSCTADSIRAEKPHQRQNTAPQCH